MWLKRKEIEMEWNEFLPVIRPSVLSRMQGSHARNGQGNVTPPTGYNYRIRVKKCLEP